MRATLFSFMVATLLLAMVPGPSTAVILRQTLSFGRRTAFATVFGNSSGLFAWALAAAFGVSGVLAVSQTAYNVVRFVGAGVLFVLGLRTLVNAKRTAARAHDVPGDAIVVAGVQVSALAAFRTGFLTNLTNPKAAVFALSFLPQFVPAGAPVLTTTVPLALLWAAVDTSWYLALISLVHHARKLLVRTTARRRIEQASGLMLVGFGVRLAFEAH